MKLRDMYQSQIAGTDLVLAEQANFNGVACDFYDSLQREEIFMTRQQIGQALGYDNPNKAVDNIHQRHKDRLDKFSTTLTLGVVEGGRTVNRDTTVYEPKGVYEICRWSRQPKADDFMDFVWNVVETVRKNRQATALTNDEIVERAAQKVAKELLPQFFKTIAPTLSRNIIEQIRSLPQGETLLQAPQPPQPTLPLTLPQVIPPVEAPTKKKRGKRIMKYTIHTWRIITTEKGLEAVDKVDYTTTNRARYIEKLEEISKAGLQFVVEREKLGMATA